MTGDEKYTISAADTWLNRAEKAAGQEDWDEAAACGTIATTHAIIALYDRVQAIESRL